MSQITSHILDTTSGKPAAGITCSLLYEHSHEWQEIAVGITNLDGRVNDLLPAGEKLPAGNYKVKFFTKPYFDLTGQQTFYPWIEIVFTISTADHYHIPLLLSPFGFSSYRGS